MPLSDLLSRVRNVLMIPAHLTKEQRLLVYRDKKIKLLNSNAGTAYIGDEEFKLQHINRLEDVPQGYKVLQEAMSLMSEKRDWDNLPRLLHGLNNAKVLKLDKKKYQARKSTIARKAGQAGRQDVLLECIRRSHVTGMTLREPEFVAQVMFWLQMKALESDWEVEDTSKALKWAELVMAMMEDPKHTAGSLVGVEDPRTKADVIGVLLELAAVRASRHLGGKDKEGKVAKYAEMFLDSLNSPISSSSFEPYSGEEAGGFRKPDPHGKALSRWVSTHTPILFGIKEAIVVLGSESGLTSGLQAKADELEGLIRVYGEALAKATVNSDTPPKGIQLYKRLFPEGQVFI